MTRINTNVSALVARNTLGRSNAALEQSLTRLSTGLRINTGKDDPAGLIASENLRSDITSIKKAIGNTDRANQVIATADSALGQVSSLLNDIRGLVTESANAGALSDEQLAANQLQVDSSLEALNRIAQTTTFQGRRLLDGSLDFLTSAGTNFSRLSDLKIDQANLGATGSVSVDVKVSTAATKAEVAITNIPAAVTGVNSTGSLTFDDIATASGGTVQFATTAKQASGGVLTYGSGTINIAADAGGLADGAEGNQLATITLTFGGGSAGAVYTAATNTLAVTVTTADGATDVTDIAAAISAGSDFTATAGTNPLVNQGAATAATVSTSLTGGSSAGTQTITIVGDTGAATNFDITVVEAAGIGATPTVTGDADNGYIVRVDSGAQNTTLSAIATAIDSITGIASATASTPSAIYNGSADTSLASPGVTESLTGGADAGSDIITITANAAGANNRLITFTETNLGDDVINVTDNGTTIAIAVDDTSVFNLSDIINAINNESTGIGANYTASLTQNDVDGEYDSNNDTAPAGADLVGPTGGVAASGGLAAAVILELAGANGAEVLSFGVGTSIADLVAGINLLQDATGVEASIDGTTPTTLNLNSTGYGSAALVDLKVISEGSGSTPSGVFTSSIGSGSRDSGTDVVASVNGVVATGKGNQVKINTATLDLSATLEAEFTGTASFTITGGGALFQLGPDVVSNQQARLGIGSVNTARLGGVDGKLFQLGTGGTASLTEDTTIAARIVEDAINQVTSLRGRLGAFQRTTLETNKQALGDTLVNLTDAESSIRDADFAEESASLTRAQILVQSGTTVLQIANSNPQNVLALLR